MWVKYVWMLDPPGILSPGDMEMMKSHIGKLKR